MQNPKAIRTSHYCILVPAATIPNEMHSGSDTSACIYVNDGIIHSSKMGTNQGWGGNYYGLKYRYSPEPHAFSMNGRGYDVVISMQ